AFRRGQSDPSEMGGGAAGTDRDGHPPAAYAAFATIPRYRQGGHAAGRRHADGLLTRRRRQGGMTRPGRAAVAAVLALTLAGCGTLFDSAKVDYKSEKKLPPLEMPPDLSTPARDDRYQIPERNATGATTLSAYNAQRSG